MPNPQRDAANREAILNQLRDEPGFRQWYAQVAKDNQLDPNPDDPLHFYDYRAAYRAGAKPDANKHWPSEFKREGHPNQFVGGVDTRTGRAAPVASHPANSAILLESLRTRATPKIPTSGPMGRTRIGPETNPETRVEMMGEAVNEGGGGDYYTRPENVPAFSKLMNEYMNQRLRSPTAIFDAPMGMAFDDVAARMGKPAGAFRTVVEQRPSGELTLAVKDAVAKTYGGKPYEETAGWMDLGSNVIDDHLSVDNVFLYDDYRGKGLGRELYQEAINEAKKLGHRGLASNPVTRNTMSERLWKDRPGVTESASGRYELMSEYLPRLDPPRAAATPPPSQYVAPGQPHPLIRLLMEQKPR